MLATSSLSDFLATDVGQYLLAWEQSRLNESVADLFGYRAVQLGVPRIDALRENRMPLRCLILDDHHDTLISANPLTGGQWLAAPWQNANRLLARFDELPFASQSLDLVVMPHTLEMTDEPHQVLREVDRVLMPDGHVVVTGFNPASLWGLRQHIGRVGMRPYWPPGMQPIALPRLKDWLKLLSFEVNRGRFGCYVPAVRTRRWLERYAFMEKAGDRWWPVLGGMYTLTAVKRVRGIRLIGPTTRRRDERPRVLVPASIAPFKQS
jgi:SAM-dependent methyltransferase